MTAPQAARFHLEKLAMGDDLFRQANHAVNPSPRSIRYMRDRWLKTEHGGLDNLSMAEAIRKYATDNPEVTLIEDINEDQLCAVLVTAFMKRVHTKVKEAEEVVFVDATGGVDRLNISVVPFLCAGPAGALPLAILFTSSQDEASLRKGNYYILYSC